MKKNKIIVIGLGHIGLPTAALFANSGNVVEGFDIDSQKVDSINAGDSLFYEPGLNDLLERSLNKGTFCAVKELSNADTFVIAVPTPLSEGNNPDVSYVSSAVKSIAPFLEVGNLIVIESTSPVGTTHKMYDLISSLRGDLFTHNSKDSDVGVHMAYCSERAIPGNSIREMVDNRRVIGGLTDSCALKAKRLYASFVRGELITTELRNAEMSKLVENTYRDVNIAFANELSFLCDSLSMDVSHVSDLANGHPRVNILEPSIGVGGHCLPVDPWFLISENSELTPIMKLARATNDKKTKWIAQRIQHQIDLRADLESRNHNKRLSIAFLGLAYKPDSSDIRNSPALKICENIVSHNDLDYNFVEPNLVELPETLCGDKSELVSLEKAHNSDLIFLLVKHSDFGLEFLEDLGSKLIAF